MYSLVVAIVSQHLTLQLRNPCLKILMLDDVAAEERPVYLSLVFRRTVYAACVTIGTRHKAIPNGS